MDLVACSSSLHPCRAVREPRMLGCQFELALWREATVEGVADVSKCLYSLLGPRTAAMCWELTRRPPRGRVLKLPGSGEHGCLLSMCYQSLTLHLGLASS